MRLPLILSSVLGLTAALFTIGFDAADGHLAPVTLLWAVAMVVCAWLVLQPVVRPTSQLGSRRAMTVLGAAGFGVLGVLSILGVGVGLLVAALLALVGSTGLRPADTA